MIKPEPGSPADRALRGLPSQRSKEHRAKASCKCAVKSCGHCRRDHEQKDGRCLECPCQGFL